MRTDEPAELDEESPAGAAAEESAPSAIELILQKAREVAGDPLRFGKYADDPLGFAEDVLGLRQNMDLGIYGLWDKQKEILLAAATYARVTVRAGHSVGKSFVMAVLTLWWLYARRGMVITTATTKSQVEQVLWREINDLADKAIVPLPGTALDTERKINRTWFAAGISPGKDSSFQGRHHPDLLVIVDEAGGVDEARHLEISTLATGAKNCIVMIGNPTQTSGTFYDSHTSAGTDWHCIHISCLDHPNVKAGKELIPGSVTVEWVERWRRKWGVGHAMWDIRVLGDFPGQSEKGTIPLLYAKRGEDQTKGEDGLTKRERALADAKKRRVLPIIALDVARYGSNKCVMGLRYGDAVESIQVWGQTSTMATVNRAYDLWRETGASKVVVDVIGLGGGVVDRLLELGVPCEGFNSQHRAWTYGEFSSRRSELWWLVRLRLENDRLHYPMTEDDNGNVAPGGQLIKDLVAPEYGITGTGRLKVETKEDLLARQVPSPDYADMLVMLFADENPEIFLETLKADPEQDPAAFDEEQYEALDPLDECFEGFPRGY